MNLRQMMDEPSSNSLRICYEDIDKKPKIQMRWVLAILGLFVYTFIFMIRDSFDVAIVAMVNSTASEKVYVDVCIESNRTKEPQKTGSEFYWTESQTGQILGAYTWGVLLSKVFGGRLGEIFGQRLVVATGLILTFILEILSPTLASIDPYALFTARFLVGCSNGPIFTAFQSLMSRWAPREHLAAMLSTAFTGITLGSTIGTFSAGWIVDAWGWRWVFWSESFACLILLPFWIVLVRNDPKDHPYVTPHEMKILDGNKSVETKKTVPWKKIFSCPYLYACIFAQFARSWIDDVQNGEGPTFYDKKIGFQINIASTVVAVTNGVGVLSLLAYGRLSDFIINHKYVSTLTSRRLMHFIGAGIASIFYLALGLSGCNVPLVIIFWVLAGTVIPATFSSFNVSIIDFAPNYTGTVMGLVGLGDVGASLSPIVASTLIQQVNGWNKVFFVCSGISMASCLVYIIFITDQPQPWNYEDGKTIKEVADPQQTTAAMKFDSFSEDTCTHL